MIALRRCTAATLLVAVYVTPARAGDSDTSIEVVGGLSASTNPFLTTGTRTGAGSAFIEVRPEFRQSDEKSTLTIRGLLRGEQYSRRYSTDQAAALSLDATSEISERLKVRGGGTFRSNRSSAQDILTDQAIGLVPVPGLQPTQGDINAIGQRTRTLAASANAGATFAVSSTQTWDADVAAGIYRYKGANLSDYRFANQQFAYARMVSGRTWLKASVGLAQIDYLKRLGGDALIVSPLAGFETRLGERLTGSIQAGLTFTSIQQSAGERISGSGLGLRASLCGDQKYGRFCVVANRSTQPTALGTVSEVTAIAGSMTRRLNSQDTLQLNANFSRTSDSMPQFSHPTFLGASAEVVRVVRDGYSLFGGVDYSDIFDRTVDRRANFHARVGLRYRFGALR